MSRVRITAGVPSSSDAGACWKSAGWSGPQGGALGCGGEILFHLPIRSLDNRLRFSEFHCMATKAKTIKDKFTKTQILERISEDTELSRKQVASVLDSLSEVIQLHVNKRSVGEFVLPGVLKIITVRKPATKARKGINPFTKEEVMFKAKPASTVVKVRPLKKLKDMVL
jgi:nucleoid DNA-binding protein